MKSKLFLALCIAAATVSCGRVSGTTKIIGTIDDVGLDEVNIVVEKLQIDTLVPVVDGKFSCEIPTDPTELGLIAVGYNTAAFIPDGSKISVTLGSNNSVTSSSKKSPQAQYTAMVQYYADTDTYFMNEMQAISDREDLTDEDKEVLLKDIYESTVEDITTYLEQLTQDNSDNAVSAVALNTLYAMNLLDDDALVYLIGTLSDEMQSNTVIASMMEDLNVKKGTAEGKMFTDFTVEDSDGKTVSLSDYVGKGKYVLVDFWASWCGPCKEEIPNIRAVYNKYHNKGLEVLSIAVWDDPEDTKVAARENGVIWNQIINAGSAPTDIYGITGIPHIILFGPDGTILKRELRGEAIEQEISKYIQ